MSFKVKCKEDGDFFGDLEKSLTKLENTHLEYGYMNSKIHKESKLPMTTLAVYMERGTSTIPARPFVFYSAIRLYTNTNYLKLASKLYRKTIKEKSVDRGSFVALGRLAKNAIKESIDSQNFVPLAQSTIKQKGHDYILYETGELRKSSQYKIVEGKPED